MELDDFSGALARLLTNDEFAAAPASRPAHATDAAARLDTASERGKAADRQRAIRAGTADTARAEAEFDPSAQPHRELEGREEPFDLVPTGGEVTPRGILEALLFVGHPANEPLTSQQAAGLMRGVEPPEIDALVEELNARYEANGAPYTIQSQGAGYRLVLRSEHAPLRDRFRTRVRQARLSPAAIEVLAVVSYHQPVTRHEVEQLRGATPSSSILRQLVRRQLLQIERPAEKPREVQYRTTQRFLDLFGLASLDDLPRPQEVDRR